MQHFPSITKVNAIGPGPGFACHIKLGRQGISPLISVLSAIATYCWHAVNQGQARHSI